jgi:hypothetical protein
MPKAVILLLWAVMFFGLLAAGVEGIVLLFSANDGSGPVYKFPAYDYFAPVLEPLLEEVSWFYLLSIQCYLYYLYYLLFIICYTLYFYHQHGLLSR